MNVRGVVMTSLPFGKFRTMTARCNAAVQELKPTAYFVPENFAKSSSNCVVLVPIPNQPDFMTDVTASISSFPMLGRNNGIIFYRIFYFVVFEIIFIVVL